MHWRCNFNRIPGTDPPFLTSENASNCLTLHLKRHNACLTRGKFNQNSQMAPGPAMEERKRASWDSCWLLGRHPKATSELSKLGIHRRCDFCRMSLPKTLFLRSADASKCRHFASEEATDMVPTCLRRKSLTENH